MSRSRAIGVGDAGLPMQLMSDEEGDSDGEQDGLLDGSGSDLPSSSAAESDDDDDSGELLCFPSGGLSSVSGLS